MSIEPDTKDRTWVLERTCPECGYSAASVAAADVAEAVRSNAAGWAEVVFRLYDYRLSLMLEQDEPLYPNWDQDATAIENRYDEQEPETVSAELAGAAQAIATHFDTVTGDQWQRRGRRSDGASFTVDSFARYFLHDVVHHLHDVRG